MQNLPKIIQSLIVSKMRPQDLMELRKVCDSFRDAVDEVISDQDYLHRA